MAAIKDNQYQYQYIPLRVKLTQPELSIYLMKVSPDQYRDVPDIIKKKYPETAKLALQDKRYKYNWEYVPSSLKLKLRDLKPE